LKAADDTKKERFDDFIARAEQEGFLDPDQIDDLRLRYEDGDVADEDLPLPLDEAIDDDLDEQDVEDAKRRLGAAILLATLAGRALLRDRLQTKFEDRAAARAAQPSLAQWQKGFKDDIARYITDQAVLGDRGTVSAERLQSISDIVQQQQAYLSRFADQRAARALTGDEMTDAYIAARSQLYSGQGRAEWFKGVEDEEATPDTVVYYEAVGDASTCNACLHAEAGSPYLPGKGPYPGEVCDGHGYCRCERRPVHDPELARILLGEVI
jgi:hypothetical protein